VDIRRGLDCTVAQIDCEIAAVSRRHPPFGCCEVGQSNIAVTRERREGGGYTTGGAALVCLVCLVLNELDSTWSH
jgi:hypothetical protein